MHTARINYNNTWECITIIYQNVWYHANAMLPSHFPQPTSAWSALDGCHGLWQTHGFLFMALIDVRIWNMHKHTPNKKALLPLSNSIPQWICGLKEKQVSWNVCIFFLASSLEKLRSEKARGLGKWIPPQGRPGLPAKDGKGVWSSFGDSKVLFGKTEIHGFFTYILIKEIKCVCEDILNF